MSKTQEPGRTLHIRFIMRQKNCETYFWTWSQFFHGHQKADELQSDATLVPDMLYNMLAWILTSDTEFSTERVTNLPNHVHRWILSLGQDLIHCVSRGRTKTPRHVLLPMTVKSLTEKAELVTLLNRFGPGLSYSQAEELETAIAEQQITNLRNDVLSLTVCSPSVSAIFCWDNNELQEKTLSGI